MKLTRRALPLLLCCATMTGCIKDEAPNAEADITSIYFEDDILANEDIDLNPAYSSSLNAYPIEVKVKAGTALDSLAPLFTLTEGATISPESGSAHDFSDDQRVAYAVTSEDGNWVRDYSIRIREQLVADIPLTYHFEDVELVTGILTTEDPYHVFVETDDEGLQLTWASGNEGYNWAVTRASTEDYPTVRSDDGYEGYCAKLETKETGSLGKMVGMPIAAGNLFIGKFDMTNAISKPLESTLFGTPFCYKPVRITGWYKYTPGEEFYEDGEYTDREDEMNIYGIFYEGASTYDSENVPQDDLYLDGNLPILDYDDEDGLMVALALMEDPQPTEEWTYFEIDFDYDRYGKTIDEEKLKNGAYKMGIIFAASKDGALFEGAPGSTLLVDEVTLEVE